MQRGQVPLRYDGTHADQLGQVLLSEPRAWLLDVAGMLSAIGSVDVQALEIIPGRLFMCAMRTTDGMQRSNTALTSICYCIDAELVLGSAILAVA